MGSTHLLAELKRRNVLRMAGLYLVGAWLITQVAGTLLPMFDAPGWVARNVVILLAIGFVPAMLFGWAFELTPHGLKRDAEVPPENSIAPQTARRLDRMLLLVSALALGYFAFDKFILAPRREVALVAQTTATISAKHRSATPKVDPRSIAVLPFVNMSGDPANEYFSDGISEEILNVLAGTPELQVAARTSSFSFKGKNAEVPAIARALGVRMVLEGSVRKQGEQVRITAQLIDAQSGFHRWSQTYDRKLEDIFAIQDEIARSIGDEMKVQIAANAHPGKAAGGKRNPAVYDLYLRGMALWHTRRGEALWEAVGLFERAVEMDPTYAQGYAGLSLAYGILGDYSIRLPYAETLARARNSAERALALDPSLPEPYAALGLVASKELRRDTSDALLRRSILLRPSFATAHQWRGSLLMSGGDPEGGLAALERASKLDPRSLVVSQNHTFVLRTLGRDADAKTRCLRTLAFAPRYGPCLEDVALAEMRLGNLDAARVILERQAAVDNPSAAGQGRELVAALKGGNRRALAVRYAALPYNSKFDPASGNSLEGYDMPSVLMLLGENALALEYVEHLAGQLGGTADWAIMLPALNPIRCEPRFKAVVARLKTTDPHAARVCGKSAAPPPEG